MKLSKKQISTGIMSTVIMLMLFAIFTLVFDNQQTGKISYLVDDINVCTWEEGVIISTTEAFGPLRVHEVDVDDDALFLESAERGNKCVAKLGDNSGSYANSLNTQYQNQE